MACEAVEESKDSEFAHFVPGSAGKWHRYRWDVVLSNRRGPSEPFLSYRVWTLQDGPERPVAKGERVIWIGVNPNPGNYRGVKALPDTPENREKFAHGWAVMGAFERGDGRVFTTGCTDWAYGLDDPVVSRITRNVIERFLRKGS